MVVIAILAAITIVAYNGITNQAKEAALKSDLKTAATQLGITKTDTGSYPTDDSALKKSNGTNFQYAANNTNSTFCLTATNPQLSGKAFYITQDGSIQTGTCPGDVTTIAGSMQSFTLANCTALTTFTGANTTAIIGLTDSRGGTTRTYQVAKLADNKCWMLTNLKLGSTTATTTLTSSDSNVASNFILPQVIPGTSADAQYDSARAFGPVPGDTSAGETNYGYLYNWSAATAGETRTSKPAGSGDASYSICPAGWRLPSGGMTAGASDFSRLDQAFGGSGVGHTGSTNWQYAGPFKGVFSGYWWDGSFSDQSGGGYLWSRSAHTSFADYAFYAYFDSGYVYPGNVGYFRFGGFGVRCLLN